MSSGRQLRPPDPTPEEIARICAEIREGWDARKWEAQQRHEESVWNPMLVKSPHLNPGGPSD